MYPAALHKFPTQTVDSSHVSEKCVLQKQPKMINKLTKVGTETQSAILNRFVPNRPKISSFDCCRQRQIYLG